MKERWSTPSPRHPSWESSTASPTPCSCPRASPSAGVVILHGAGLGEGVALRLRARLPRRRHRRAGLRRPRARALARASSGRARSTTRCAMVELLRGARRARWRCAARAWAASRRSTPARATTSLCAVVAICPAPEDLLLRGLRSGEPLGFRCDVPADRAVAGDARHLRGGRRARARRPPCCSCTRAATSRSPGRSARSCTPRRTSPSGCWCCPAATTARCSTTWSCRRCPAASSWRPAEG